MKKSLLYLFAVLAMISCNRNDDTSSKKSIDSVIPEPRKVEKKIQQINKDNTLYAKMYYKDTLLSGIDFFEKGSVSRKRRMIYENGLMRRLEFYNAEHNLTGYNENFFEGKLVIRSDFYRTITIAGKEKVSFVTKRMYTNREGEINNLIEMTDYSPEGDLKGSLKIEYNDNQGSSTSTYYSVSGKKYATSTWVKDNKKAFDKYFDAFPYQHEHNTISISYKNLDRPDLNWGYTNLFTYDDEGYPLTCVRTNSDGTIEKFEYIWE